MKCYSSVYTVVVALLLALSAGCNKKSADSPQSTGEGSATIKLTQNGQVITEFTTTNVSGIGGNDYTVIIASPDEKHNLTLYIIGQSAGNYPFINPTQTLSNGKANFLYQSYALPAVYAGTVGVLAPETGQTVLSTATKTQCSGTFTSTGKNAKDGKMYTLEGTFNAPALN